MASDDAFPVLFRSGGSLGNMESKKHIVIGTREHWGQMMPLVLSHNDRRQHLYCLGKSGTGKTTLLHNLMVQDIEAGHGLAFIDPHGDESRNLLDYIPSRRIKDVVYFNPADTEHPIGFNLLGSVPPDNRHLVASGVVRALSSGSSPNATGRSQPYFYRRIIK